MGDHCVRVESMDVCKQRTIESSRVCHVQPYRCYPDTGLLGLAVLWVVVLGTRTFLSTSRLVGTPRIRGGLCMGGDWGDAECSEHEGRPWGAVGRLDWGGGCGGGWVGDRVVGSDGFVRGCNFREMG